MLTGNDMVFNISKNSMLIYVSEGTAEVGSTMTSIEEQQLGDVDPSGQDWIMLSTDLT
jgi:hypothetical protein